jgi:proton glutamate symport protein
MRAALAHDLDFRFHGNRRNRGYDFPHQAIALQIITQIFLRLIKTIIAPLIFSTLVVGVAGHSDMKQVGRMGLKALI